MAYLRSMFRILLRSERLSNTLLLWASEKSGRKSRKEKFFFITNELGMTALKVTDTRFQSTFLTQVNEVSAHPPFCQHKRVVLPAIQYPNIPITQYPISPHSP